MVWPPILGPRINGQFAVGALQLWNIAPRCQDPNRPPPPRPRQNGSVLRQRERLTQYSHQNWTWRQEQDCLFWQEGFSPEDRLWCAHLRLQSWACGRGGGGANNASIIAQILKIQQICVWLCMHLTDVQTFTFWYKFNRHAQNMSARMKKLQDGAEKSTMQNISWHIHTSHLPSPNTVPVSPLYRLAVKTLTCTHIHTHTQTHTNTFTNTDTDSQFSARVTKHAFMHTHVCVYAHTRTHTHAHINTYKTIAHVA